MTADHPVRPWYVCSGDPCRCAKPKTLAPELSPEEAARVAVFDAAEEPEEVVIERIVDALYGVKWPDGEPYLHMARTHARKLATAALTALRGDRAPLAGQHTTDEDSNTADELAAAGLRACCGQPSERHCR